MDTVRSLAEVRGSTPEALAAQTSANFESVCLRAGPGNG